MALMSARMLTARLRGTVVPADGAMGTELIRAGIAADSVVRANISRPDLVCSIHRDYLRAGAQWLTCNTFGLDIGPDWAEALQAGVRLALQTAREHDTAVAVWVSVPATVAIRDAVAQGFLRGLQIDSPLPILIETATSLNEAVAAIEHLRETGAPLVACTCHFRTDGLMQDGATPERAALSLVVAGADVIGANCGDGPEAFIEVTRRMRAVTDHPLLIRPNAGLPVADDGGRWNYPVSEEVFARTAERIVTAGASVVGGCCGTTPSHIRAMCARMDNLC